jgi:hypothetical protein
MSDDHDVVLFGYFFELCFLFMNDYPESLDKIALAVESAKIAKSMIVQQEGIGEDMSFNLMVWRDSQLVAVAQLSQSLMGDPEERYGLVVQAACVLRQGWGATGFTMVAEGYCSTNLEESQGKDMAQLFASPTTGFVKECLSFTHVQEDGILFVVVPYRYLPPRKVQYYKPMAHNGAGVVREARYPMSLHRALELPYEIDDVDEDDLRSELANGLTELGFEVNYR